MQGCRSPTRTTAGSVTSVVTPDDDLETVGPGRARREVGRVRWAIEWLLIGIAAFTVALLVRATVVQAFYIPSESMVPTLRVHDRLLVEKISYHVHDVRRGDIVVFERPSRMHDLSVKDLIKRVIGLPGDTVEAHDGKVFVNGRRLAEPYLPADRTTADFGPVTVPLDGYFVMGDNRAASYDSRFWGTVDRSLIVGRAVVRVFPPGRIGPV